MLLVVDMQERLVSALPERDRLLIVQRVALLMQAARFLGVPTLLTAQLAKEDDPIVPAIARLVQRDAIVPKQSLSCAEEGCLIERLDACGRQQVVLCGAETHVCVLQSAVGLQLRGQQPFVVGDAVGARLPTDHEAGLARLRQLDVQIVSADMVLFEWLRRSGTREYDEIVALKMRHGLDLLAQPQGPSDSRASRT